jgi:isopentenyl diphosphate isomerase/L-lactate dehydrogenase-like FMN-dependent dehydrogenase
VFEPFKERITHDGSHYFYL